MIFDFPERHRENQIGSMYKSLIVNDLVTSGRTKEEVIRGLRMERISTRIQSRCLSPFEFLSYIGQNRYKAETQILCEIMNDVLFSSTEKLCETSRNEQRDSDRYLERAKTLSKLAETGNFKDYPRHLK